jgi:hypothetical protein
VNAINRTICAPFANADHKMIIVKVIGLRGSELLLVKRLEEAR